jgi:signal transduction histidine kinase
MSSTSVRLLTVALNSEQDIVALRQRARQIADKLYYGVQDQVRIATAVSEVARHALVSAQGARCAFEVDTGEAKTCLQVSVRYDHDQARARAQSNSTTGKEIAPVVPAPSSTAISTSASARKADSQNVLLLMDSSSRAALRLMDHADVHESAGVLTVQLQKNLPSNVLFNERQLRQLGSELADSPLSSTLVEIQTQNLELIDALAELRDKQDSLVALTQELEDTNRGVVALYAEIEEKAERLRSADEMKSRFLSNTSHELRTPLSSIRALSKLLLDRMDGELTVEQERQVQFIASAANNLSDLVNDLLDLAKIESGKEVVNHSLIHVATLFSSLKGMLRPLIVNPAVELVFDHPGDLSFLSDEGKVAQILRNFISNALKFTEHGEIRVSALLDTAQGRVLLSVTDTGIGIAPNQFDLIFEEFGQIKHPLQGKVKGTGLGLPLCKKIASLLSGAVEVESTPGRGSVFRLIVPSQIDATLLPTSLPPSAAISLPTSSAASLNARLVGVATGLIR